MLAWARNVVALVVAALIAPLSSAQTWDTAATHPGEVRFHQPDYPVAFVATLGHADEEIERPAHIGLDVISAPNPAAQGPGGGLYVLLPSGRVEKLFPLAVHESVAGLIDTPAGQLWRGAVVEPNMSEDGRTLYFAWFHDATWEPSDGGYLSLRVSYKGADLYRLDVGPLLDDLDVDPATLPIRRLTRKEYTGPPKGHVLQALADRTRDAVNPGLAADGSSQAYWGTVDMHAIELRTRAGLKLAWVSDRARVLNSNDQVGDPNHAFALYVADILPDGSLAPAQQFQYYTTTSALSPTPMRSGFSFSYQSSTEEVRRWDIQWLDSEGRWKPLIGYAHASELFHLGCLVVERGVHGELVDSFVGVKYYHMNDEGFGALHRVATVDAGTNRFVPGAWGTSPRQLSEVLTIGALDRDGPSPQVNVGGQTLYVGKFSSPRAGRLGGEYFMAYTPTSANRWLLDADGRKCVWESEIAYRPSLRPFRPQEPVDPGQGTGLYTAVRDGSREYDLAWPTPLLSWLERTGEPTQRVDAPIIDPRSPVPAGYPVAIVGTSALWNTDVRPFDCYLGSGRPFDPNELNSNEEIQVIDSQEGLRYVQDVADVCQYLRPETVLGIRIQLTSHRTDLNFLNVKGYETDGMRKVESVRNLGVYSVVDQNHLDQSFQAAIPSDVPFEFHLLDRRYGMKLADVRSWHSLKARETRNDCGGCHQHEAGFGIPFAGTEASTRRPFDLVRRTTYVEYDANCKPVIGTATVPALATPEWKADVWPGFAAHCGSCHDATRSSDALALEALDYVDEEDAYDKLRARRYAGSDLGALGSPAFWAAYGERTDGRDNAYPGYAPDRADEDWGYRFSPIHALEPGLCAAANPEWAHWVRRFGEWIDNHMPRDTGDGSFPYQHDRYPPTVDLALTPDGSRLRIGTWDDSGRAALAVEWNGKQVWTRALAPNGVVALGVPNGVAATDRVRVIVTDPSGNRQLKTKSVSELVLERVR